MLLGREIYLSLVEQEQKAIYQHYREKRGPTHIEQIIQGESDLGQKYMALTFAFHQIAQPITIISGYIKIEEMAKRMGISTNLDGISEVVGVLQKGVSLIRENGLKKGVVFGNQQALRFALQGINKLNGKHGQSPSKEGDILTYEQVMADYFNILLENHRRLKALLEEQEESEERGRIIDTLEVRLQFYRAFITGEDVNLKMEDIGIKELEELIPACLGSTQVNISSLVIETGKNIAAVKANMFMLKEVISNIFSNADRHKLPGQSCGEVQIEIVAIETREYGSWARIMVGDFGIGIPPGEESTIFRFGVKGSNVQNRSGQGIGLHLSREMIRRTGGEMWANSPGENMGATFYIILPATTKG